ncbi:MULTISPECIES: hypothetical protein [Streptomyces]|uniref:hypothetical protein n=1 Tax=Streptomyces TaxID=1883 RepID=UPI0029A43FA5|nr:hypothetical protein [Streptomyces scabiei]MDX3115513.1 hypothetical protein [Streptomyces scabiei]
MNQDKTTFRGVAAGKRSDKYAAVIVSPRLMRSHEEPADGAPPTAGVTAVDTHDTRIPARRGSIERYTRPGGGLRAADRESRKEKTA